MTHDHLEALFMDRFLVLSSKQGITHLALFRHLLMRHLVRLSDRMKGERLLGTIGETDADGHVDPGFTWGSLWWQVDQAKALLRRIL